MAKNKDKKKNKKEQKLPKTIYLSRYDTGDLTSAAEKPEDVWSSADGIIGEYRLVRNGRLVIEFEDEETKQ